MKKELRMFVAVLTVGLFTFAVTADEEQNLAPNPGGEETHSYADQKKLVKYFSPVDKTKPLPKGWGVYVGGGKWDYGISTEEKKNGKNSVYVELVKTLHNDKKNCDWGSVAIHFAGECDGYLACNAMKVKAGEKYRFSFWIKGDIPQAKATATGFLGADSQKKNKRVWTGVVMYDSEGNKIKTIVPTNEWKEYSAEVTVPEGCEQMTFGVANISGYAKGESDKVGSKMFIDDVKIVKKD